MAEMQMMEFPKTVDEFMESYKIVDTEQVYTNGSELVPIFRMRQWFEHLNGAEWISVKERLPELGEEVLVYYHWITPPEKASITRDSMHIHDRSMKPVWGKHRNDKVTHWMPLPEPPKEEQP